MTRDVTPSLFIFTKYAMICDKRVEDEIKTIIIVPNNGNKRYEICLTPFN